MDKLFSKAFNMDCVKGMKMLESECIDLVVTSPPYDNIRDYNGYVFDYKKTLEELFRILKTGGVVVWIVSDQTVDGDETGTSFKQALYAKECGFNLHDTMIWKKDGCPFPESVRYHQNFEYMFIFSKGKPKTVNIIKDRKNLHSGEFGLSTKRYKDGELKRITTGRTTFVEQEYGARFNVWEIPNEKNNTSGHPAVFPSKLVKDHITSWSNERDVVMDPFLGSGTTRIVAYDMNRSFVGYEISKEYFDKQEERFKEHASQMSLFNSDDCEEIRNG